MTDENAISKLSGLINQTKSYGYSPSRESIINQTKIYREIERDLRRLETQELIQQWGVAGANRDRQNIAFYKKLDELALDLLQLVVDPQKTAGLFTKKITESALTLNERTLLNKIVDEYHTAMFEVLDALLQKNPPDQSTSVEEKIRNPSSRDKSTICCWI